VRILFARAGNLPPLGEPSGPLVIMPFTQAEPARRAAAQLAARAGTGGLLLALQDDQSRGFIACANQAFRASAHPLVAYVAQDAFAGRNWLSRGVQAIGQGGAALLAFNDGKWSGQLAAFGLVRREWASLLYGGDLFYPGYEAHFADVELTLLALAERRLAYDPNAVLVEVDNDKDKRSVNPHDRRVFAARKANGFGGRVRSPGLLGMFS